MDTDSPWEGLRSSKIAQSRAKSRKIAPKRSGNGENGTHAARRSSYCVIFTRIELFGSSEDKESLSLRPAAGCNVWNIPTFQVGKPQIESIFQSIF